jgi:hypothetical protein
LVLQDVAGFDLLGHRKLCPQQANLLAVLDLFFRLPGTMDEDYF